MKGTWVYTYDIYDEIEAFKAEAKVFGKVRINDQFLSEEGITLEALALFPPYDKLPQKKLSIDQSFEKLLPVKIETRSKKLDLTDVDVFKASLASEGKFDIEEIKNISKTSTLKQLLETVCSDGELVWKKLKLQKTW